MQGDLQLKGKHSPSPPVVDIQEVEFSSFAGKAVLEGEGLLGWKQVALIRSSARGKRRQKQPRLIM